jgi:hypothetical protein
VRWCLCPKVFELLRRGVATEYLVAVRVASEARYDLASSLGLRNPELGACPEVGGRVCRFLLGVAKTLRSWRAGSSECLSGSQEHPLHSSQLAVSRTCASAIWRIECCHVVLRASSPTFAYQPLPSIRINVFPAHRPTLPAQVGYQRHKHDHQHQKDDPFRWHSTRQIRGVSSLEGKAFSSLATACMVPEARA